MSSLPPNFISAEDVHLEADIGVWWLEFVTWRVICAEADCKPAQLLFGIWNRLDQHEAT